MRPWWGITFKKSWDLFRLPCPYSRAVLVCAPLIFVPAGSDGDGVKRKQAEVQSTLERTRDIAEAWFDLTEEERDLIRADWSQNGPCRSLQQLNIDLEEGP